MIVTEPTFEEIKQILEEDVPIIARKLNKYSRRMCR